MIDVVWIAALLILIGLVTADLAHARFRALEDAQALAMSDARLAGRYASERLSVLDSALRVLERHFAPPAESPGIPRAGTQTLLSTLAPPGSPILALGVLDHDGILRATSLTPTMAGADLSDRDFFRELSASPTATYYVSGQQTVRMGKAAGRSYVALSRPLRRADRDGAFDGVVTGIVDARDLARRLQESVNHPTVDVAVFTRDGRFVAGIRNLTTVDAQTACRTTGLVDAQLKLPASPDRPAAIAACTTVGGYGLTSIAVRPLEVVLAPWYVEALSKITALLALVAAVVTVAALRRRVTRASRRSRILSAALEQSSNAVMVTNRNGVIEWANKALEAQSGYTLDEIVGATPDLLKSGIQSPDYYQALWRTILAGRLWRGEVLNRRKNGDLYRVRQVITPLLDATGRVTHFVALEEDVTEIAETQAMIERMKTVDLFTGLPNRGGFVERLDEIGPAAGRHLVGVLDIENLKAVNETAGRAAGDRALLTLARALSEHDRVLAAARTGDDEFGVVLAVADHDTEALGALRYAMQVEIRRVDGCGATRVRMGYAVPGADGTTGADLLDHAESAMNAGRQGDASAILRYDSDRSRRTARRQALKHALATALDHDEISFLVQPKVDLPGCRIVGGEVLMRWTQREIGPVSPAEFIPIAEETGEIVRLGRAALDAAIAIVRKVPAEREFRIAVNASAVELSRPDYAASVIDAASRAGVRPDRLVVELTETAAATAGDTLRGQLRSLLDAGFGVDIDDFGTGYATLSQLRDLPFSGIKIDREFVAPLLTDRHSQLIVRGVVGLATSLGATVVAEGIETDATARALAEIGCGYGQGYLYGRPCNPDELLAGLSEPGRATGR